MADASARTSSASMVVRYARSSCPRRRYSAAHAPSHSSRSMRAVGGTLTQSNEGFVRPTPRGSWTTTVLPGAASSMAARTPSTRDRTGSPGPPPMMKSGTASVAEVGERRSHAMSTRQEVPSSRVSPVAIGEPARSATTRVPHVTRSGVPGGHGESLSSGCNPECTVEQRLGVFAQLGTSQDVQSRSAVKKRR